MVRQVRDFEYDLTYGDNEETFTYTKAHRAYDVALARHNRHLDQMMLLKRSLVN